MPWPLLSGKCLPEFLNHFIGGNRDTGVPFKTRIISAAPTVGSHWKSYSFISEAWKLQKSAFSGPGNPKFLFISGIWG